MNTCQVTVFQHAHAHTHNKKWICFSGTWDWQKAAFVADENRERIDQPLAIGLGGLHTPIHFSDSALSTHTPKSTRLWSLWLGYSLLLLTKQRGGIPLLVQSFSKFIYSTGGDVKTSYKMALSSGEDLIAHGTQTFNPQLWDNLWQQKYQDMYICGFFTAQLTIIIQPDRQWQILSGSLNQLVTKISGDHLAAAKVKASPVAPWLGGNAPRGRGAGKWTCTTTATETGKLHSSDSFLLERSFWGSLAARYPVAVLDICRPHAVKNQHTEAEPSSLTVSALFPQTGRAEHVKTAFTEKHQPNQYRINRGH